MNSQRIRVLTSLSLLGLDTILIALAFTWAYQLRASIPWPAPLASDIPFSAYLPRMLTHVLAVIVSLFFLRQYVIRRASSRIDQFYAVFASVTIGAILAVGLSDFMLKNTRYDTEYARVMIFYAWGLTILLVTVGRALHQTAVETVQSLGLGRDRLLIVGTGDVARIIMQRIQWSPNLGYEVIGVIDTDHSGQANVLGVPVLGQPEDLPDLIQALSIDEVIIAIPDQGHREVVRIISYCQRGMVSIKIFPDIFQFVTSQANIDDLGGLPLLSVRDYAMRGYGLLVKRLMDIIFAVLGLIFLSPLMMLVAALVKLESPGPVFFIQERMGLDGRPFPMIKFRSMRHDAEKDGPGWTVDEDPRRTRMGTLLRKIDVDEMPQLVNVLIGEMSLVGPRPEQPYYVEQFRNSVPRYMERHQVKAGMTGWAQISGLRGDTSIIERTRYDLWYTENWSILLDIKILVRTSWQLLRAMSRSVGAIFRRSQPLEAAVADK